MTHPILSCFVTPRPAVLSLPHLVTALDADLLGMIAFLTNSAPGVWGMPALFDAKDCFDNTRESGPFSEWALPLNQAELLSYSVRTREIVFGTTAMLLDSSCDEAVLARLAVAPGRRLDSGAFVTRGYHDLPELPHLLASCGWVLIPIGPERSQALFVAAPGRAGLTTELKAWCERQGRNWGEIRWEGERLAFLSKVASEEPRRRAMAHRIDCFLGELETYFGQVDPSMVPLIGERLEARHKLRDDIARAARHAPPT